jgi:hypothetical protein
VPIPLLWAAHQLRALLPQVFQHARPLLLLLGAAPPWYLASGDCGGLAVRSLLRSLPAPGGSREFFLLGMACISPHSMTINTNQFHCPLLGSI